MKTEIITVTPFIAGELLKNNTINRPLSRDTVKRYANEMSNGNWRLTGESIKILKNGKLGDGQHRLNAVILSGVSIQVVLMTDVENDSVNFMDTGKKRLSSDVVSMHYKEMKYATKITQVATKVIKYHNGNFGNGNQSMLPTNNEVLKFIQQNEDDFPDFVSEYYKLYSSSDRLLNSILLISICWIAKTNGYQLNDIESFYDACLGINLQKESYIFALRNKIHSMSILKSEVKFTPSEEFKVYATAFIKHIKNEHSSKIIIPKDMPKGF